MKKGFLFSVLFSFFAYADSSSNLENTEYIAKNMSACDYSVKQEFSGVAYKQFKVEFQCSKCTSVENCAENEQRLIELISSADLSMTSSNLTHKDVARQIKKAAERDLKSTQKISRDLKIKQDQEYEKNAAARAAAANTEATVKAFQNEYKKTGITIFIVGSAREDIVLIKKYMDILNSPRVISLLQNSAIESLTLETEYFFKPNNRAKVFGISSHNPVDITFDAADLENEALFAKKLARFPSRQSLIELRALFEKIQNKLQLSSIYCGAETSLMDCTEGAKRIVKVIDQLKPIFDEDLVIRTSEEYDWAIEKTKGCHYYNYYGSGVILKFKEEISDTNIISCINSYVQPPRKENEY